MSRSASQAFQEGANFLDSGKGQKVVGGQSSKRSEVNPGSPLGQPWVPDFWVDIRGSPHKNRQPWVPSTSFLFCVRRATRPNCQPLTLSHLESDGGPTASMPSAARPHCILPARNLGNTDYFLKIPAKSTMNGSMKLWEAAQ